MKTEGESQVEPNERHPSYDLYSHSFPGHRYILRGRKQTSVWTIRRGIGNGSIVEGPRKFIGVMQKELQRFCETRG